MGEGFALQWRQRCSRRRRVAHACIACRALISAQLCGTDASCDLAAVMKYGCLHGDEARPAFFTLAAMHIRYEDFRIARP